MKDELIKIDAIALGEIANLSDSENKVLRTLNIGRLPFFNIEIYFSQDIWDFNNYTPDKGKYKDFYDFSDLHYAYKEYVKAFVLESKINQKRTSSINKYFGYMCKIVKFLKDNYIYDSTCITLDCINKFNKLLDNRLKTENEKIHNRRLFIKLLRYIEIYKNADYSEAIEILSVNDTNALKAQIEEGKTPNIPKTIFDNIIACCINEINSNETNDSEKMEASLILLLSQVGMRITEMSLIEAGKKFTKKCFGNTEEVPFLEFKTFKTVRYMDKAKVTKSFLTEEGELAYDTLEKLTRAVREKYKVNYIFVNPNTLNPVTTITLTTMLTRFMVRNSSKIGLINREFDGFNYFTLEYNRKHKKVNERYCKHLTFNDKVAIPKPHQFRVALCNELIRKGYLLGWIVEHMNHLSVEMTLHYKRNEESEKGKKFAEGVIEGIVTGKFNLIGEEAKLLIEKIDEFIEENKFNIKTDLAEIVSALSSKVPIREKKEGFCIKSSFGKKCKYNEFMCAFEMCPNHCTTYFFADITYKRFKDKLNVIEYNIKNNFIAEANMETNKLKRITRNYLKYEIEELDREIKKQGIEAILSKHPKLEYVAHNLSNIMEEIYPWTQN